MEVRTTHDSILRAFGLLMQQAAKPRQIKQKYAYRAFGSAVHAARRLRKEEAAAIDSVVDKLKLLDPADTANNDAIQGLLKELGKQPVKFVPIKREQRVDHSKTYPYGSKRQGY